METYLFWIVPIASLLALALAWYFYKQMMLESEGTPTMEKIASYVRQGAMSYLKQQYKVVGLVFLGLVILFSIMHTLQLTKSVGAHLSFRYRSVLLLGDFPVFGNENGHLCFSTYRQCSPALFEQRTACWLSVAELLWDWSLSD